MMGQGLMSYAVSLMVGMILPRCWERFFPAAGNDSSLLLGTSIPCCWEQLFPAMGNETGIYYWKSYSSLRRS